jgi:hypothetical protein
MEKDQRSLARSADQSHQSAGAEHLQRNVPREQGPVALCDPGPELASRASMAPWAPPHGWRNGRRSGFRFRRREAYGFRSLPVHFQGLGQSLRIARSALVGQSWGNANSVEASARLGRQLVAMGVDGSHEFEGAPTRSRRGRSLDSRRSTAARSAGTTSEAVMVVMRVALVGVGCAGATVRAWGEGRGLSRWRWQRCS